MADQNELLIEIVSPQTHKNAKTVVGFHALQRWYKV